METTVQNPLAELDAIVNGLTEVREFLAAHPDLPRILGVYGSIVYLHLFDMDVKEGVDMREEYARCARILMAGAPVGSVEKDASESYQQIKRKFGKVELILQADRNVVCERRVIGTKVVEIPDPAAPKVTVEREIVEWECAPILPAEVTT